MYKKSHLSVFNTKREAKPNKYLLLILTIISLLVSYVSLKNLEWEEHISSTRGVILFTGGMIFFPSLFLLLNTWQMCTNPGKKFMKKYKVTTAGVFDISNKLVSLVQALFCAYTGFTSVTYSCARDILHTSHYISEAYAWFGAAYFFYDIWSMYKVFEAKEMQIDQNGVRSKSTDSPSMLAYVTNNIIIIAHHIFIGGFGFLVITSLRGGLGDCFFGFIFMMEASTPFVSVRGILSILGLKHTRLYIINGLTMLATFFIFRVAMFPFVLNLYARSIHVDFMEAVAKLPRNCLISIGILAFPQVYWFGLMVKGATQILFNKKTVTINNNVKVKKREKYYS